jgi:HAD superfamily hydrolase (TIGR01459 family)
MAYYSSSKSTFLSNVSDLMGRYDLVLSDVWGVIHNGVSAYRGACDALIRMRCGGIPVVLISNVPRPSSAVKLYLDELGVSREVYDAIQTSGDLSRAILDALGDKRILHLGPDRDVMLFDGLSVRRVGLEQAEYVVCTGLNDNIVEKPEQYDELLRELYARRLPMLCCNPDIVVEVNGALRYCAGALAMRYSALGGEVIHVGKPHPEIYRKAIVSGEFLTGAQISPSRILAIGDSMRTDIAGADCVGVQSLFIASGIHAKELLDGAAFNPALLAQLEEREELAPTWSMERLVW